MTCVLTHNHLFRCITVQLACEVAAWCSVCGYQGTVRLSIIQHIFGNCGVLIYRESSVLPWSHSFSVCNFRQHKLPTPVATTCTPLVHTAVESVHGQLISCIGSPLWPCTRTANKHTVYPPRRKALTTCWLGCELQLYNNQYQLSHWHLKALSCSSNVLHPDYFPLS